MIVGMASLKSEFAGQAGRLETQVGFLNVHILKWNSFLSVNLLLSHGLQQIPGGPLRLLLLLLIVDVNHICKTLP